MPKPTELASSGNRAIVQVMADPDKKPEMIPPELRDGSGWYVFVRWGNRPAEQVGGFPSEAESQQWIDQASTLWLQARSSEPRIF